MTYFDRETNEKNHEIIELRKVQALTGERNLLFVLPKIFADKLKITKGDYLSVKVINNNSLLITKTDLSKK